MKKSSSLTMCFVFFKHFFYALYYRLRAEMTRAKKHHMIKKEKGSFVSPLCNLEGNTERITIGENSIIEEYCYLNCSKSGKDITIGKNVLIYHHSTIATGTKGSIIIGDDTKINAFALIYGQGGLKVGKRVRIGPNVGIFPSNKTIKDIDKSIAEQGINCKGITIGDDVWIGHGATILDGCNIKNGAVIGAGAVVTKDVPENAVFTGVAADIKKMRNQ